MENNDICVRYSGWLVKSPPDKQMGMGRSAERGIRRFIKSRWRRRYFSLFQKPPESRYYLDYFKDELRTDLKGSINLEEVDQIISCLDLNCETKTTDLAPQFVFSLKTVHKKKPRNYYFRAESEQQMNCWVDYLCKACALQEDQPESPQMDVPPAVNLVVQALQIPRPPLVSSSSLRLPIVPKPPPKETNGGSSMPRLPDNMFDDPDYRLEEEVYRYPKKDNEPDYFKPDLILPSYEDDDEDEYREGPAESLYVLGLKKDDSCYENLKHSSSGSAAGRASHSSGYMTNHSSDEKLCVAMTNTHPELHSKVKHNVHNQDGYYNIWSSSETSSATTSVISSQSMPPTAPEIKPRKMVAPCRSFRRRVPSPLQIPSYDRIAESGSSESDLAANLPLPTRRLQSVNSSSSSESDNGSAENNSQIDLTYLELALNASTIATNEDAQHHDVNHNRGGGASGRTDVKPTEYQEIDQVRTSALRHVANERR